MLKNYSDVKEVIISNLIATKQLVPIKDYKETVDNEIIFNRGIIQGCLLCFVISKAEANKLEVCISNYDMSPEY